METKVNVTNRANGTVGYMIPDMGNFRRKFAPGETKPVPVEEVQKLMWIPGGQYLLENCLIIEDKELVEQILGDVEPEYNYTEEDIKKLLTSGTIEQFMDFMDFAPVGAIDLMKALAVKIEVNDVDKRNYILEKTGFNVNKAIEINHASSEVEGKEDKKVRRQVPITADKAKTVTPARRVVVKQNK